MSFSFCGNWVEETHLYQLNTESAEQSEKGLDLVVTQLLDNLQSLTAVMTRPVLSFFAYQKMVDRLLIHIRICPFFVFCFHQLKPICLK